MDERNEELERIQRELLAEEDIPTVAEGPSVDDILADEELNALLDDKPVPAFEDPEKIHEPEGRMQYNNFANDYGREELEDETAVAQKKDKIQIALMLTACVLCLGIIGVLIYWLNILP